MARKPQVRYFASRQAYYTQLHGKQHKLASGPEDAPTGPTYLAALEAYKQLLTLAAVGTSRDRNTIRAVLELYMQHIEGRMRPSTLRRRREAFGCFIDVHGETAVGDLTPFAIDAFLARMRQPRVAKGKTRRKVAWGNESVRSFLESINAAFRWAIKRKLITINPVDGIERPGRRSRSRECLVSDDQHRAILAACQSPQVRELVVALQATGARPGELSAASAADWNPDLQAVVYYGDDRRREDEFRHKAAGKRKDRVIYFTGEALAVVLDLLRRHPTGTLFRTESGRPWQQNNLNHAFRQLRRRAGVPGFIPYSYRHTLATNWLKAGRSVDVLAEVLGNTPETIRRHYSHLCGDRQAIRRQLEEFRGIAGPSAGNQAAVAPDDDGGK